MPGLVENVNNITGGELSSDAYAQAMSSHWSWTPGKDAREAYTNIYNNQFNAAEAQKQRDYELQMSSTQYQRAVADMKAAGLNPASLTSGGISGGSSGSSGSAASGSAKYSNKTDQLGAIAAFFVGIAKLVATVA